MRQEALEHTVRATVLRGQHIQATSASEERPRGAPARSGGEEHQRGAPARRASEKHPRGVPARSAIEERATNNIRNYAYALARNINDTCKIVMIIVSGFTLDWLTVHLSPGFLEFKQDARGDLNERSG
jgi:hypothetical protein